MEKNQQSLTTVICFGDSNTYGYIPKLAKRYSSSQRWSGILKELGKDKFNVIEQGCNNRVCFANNPAGAEFIGSEYLPFVLREKVDYLLLALGINDIQKSYNTNLSDFEKGLKRTILIAKEQSPNTKIILISPSRLSEDIFKDNFSLLFDKESIEKSKLLAPIYQKTAKELDCLFVDFDKIAVVSSLDGLHYDIPSHQAIANYMFDFLNKII